MALELDGIGARGGVRHDRSEARIAGSGKVSLVARLSPTKAQAQVQLEDGYLLALAKQGSADAYDRLVRRYYSFVRLKASSYFLVGGDSEDLIQEGLVGLYKAIRDFRTDRESLVPQLRGAVHHAPDHHRGQDRDAQQAHAAQRLRLVLGHAGAAPSDGEPTLDEVLPGLAGARPGQPGHLLRGAALAGRLPVDRALRARVARAVALPRRPLLHGDRREARLRLQDGRQRPAARQAQGRRAPRSRARSCCNQALVPTWLIIVARRPAASSRSAG